MSDIKQSYVASAALTITLASLASDATNLLAGRQSTAVDNSSNKYLDYLIGGKVTTGTTPTTARLIEVWAYATVNDTPLYTSVFTGTDGNLTVTTRDILYQAARPLAVMQTDATNDRTYWFGPVSIVSIFGEMPSHFGIWVVHNTVAALNATGSNHAIYHRAIYKTVA